MILLTLRTTSTNLEPLPERYQQLEIGPRVALLSVSKGYMKTLKHRDIQLGRKDSACH